MLDDDNVAIYICFELMDSELKDYVRKNYHLSEKELLSFAWDISEERLLLFLSVNFIDDFQVSGVKRRELFLRIF